jgi:hypothetical protein
MLLQEVMPFNPVTTASLSPDGLSRLFGTFTPPANHAAGGMQIFA